MMVDEFIVSNEGKLLSRGIKFCGLVKGKCKGREGGLERIPLRGLSAQMYYYSTGF